ncbi:L-gulonolactone oxidase 5 [Pseudolycoriella hygida]|uniref:L-gulonolactone oxidase 5 n=1 Tax=Pseudolycoriella hygida TaxID=35572 RepID=A0A9Q0S5C6_9DIPT|nr:L-gulonolactone oxidase 5 [Pseudolycoriella hygida]
MKYHARSCLMLIGLSFISCESTKDYTSYKRIPLCTPSDDIRYPKTNNEVIDIVKEAITRGVTVKPFGSRHSQTDIICTEGIPVDLRGIRHFYMHDDGITATFGSGVNLRDATEFLRKHGRGLRTTPAYGNITIGGAIGTGAHGSTIKFNASISSQVVGLTIVDGMGNVREISDPDDLKAFRVNLGLLGIVVDVTLYTVPLYKTRAHNYVVPDEALTNGVGINWAKSTDQIAFYWFPSFHEVVVANWTIVDVNTPGNARTNDHVPSSYASFNALSAVGKEIIFGLTSSTCAVANALGYTILHAVEYYLQLSLLIQTPNFAPIYTEDEFTVKNPAVGYYDLMFAPICYDDERGPLKAACVWAHGDNAITILDNEFALDLADLPNFIRDVKDVISKTPTAFPLQGILMRFSDKSDIYMSTAYGRQTVHFEFYLWNRNDPYTDPSASLAGYQTILQILTRKYKARSHWGKSGLVHHNSESLDLKLDGEARRGFVAAMTKFDPNEVFINNFGRRMKRKGTKVDIDPLTVHCALLDNCICSKDTDCGYDQTCTTLPGYTYPVCKTKNEVKEFTMDTSAFPPALGIFGFFLNNIHTLANAALSKCSLDDLLGGVFGILEKLGRY